VERHQRERLVSSMLQVIWLGGAGVVLVAGLLTGRPVQGSFGFLALTLMAWVVGATYRAQADGRLSQSKALAVRFAAIPVIFFLLYLGLRFVR
jgi:hypothetical protein